MDHGAEIEMEHSANALAEDHCLTWSYQRGQDSALLIMHGFHFLSQHLFLAPSWRYQDRMGNQCLLALPLLLHFQPLAPLEKGE
jgi:hypothetical protein